MKIRDCTSKLSWSELKEIFSNSEELEREGVIGDCLLRRKAEELMPTEESFVVLWMTLIASDCYRIVAERAMEQGFKL
jgi:hypothetical protein